MQTLRTNLVNNASSQYANFNLNSMCVFGNTILGAGDHGLYQLCCSDTANDNGDDIEAYFVPATTDFGLTERKAVRYAYLGGESNGSVLVEATGDGAKTSGPHECSFLGNEEQQQRRVSFGRGLRANFLKMKVSNASGSTFKVDSIFVHVDSKSNANK